MSTGTPVKGASQSSSHTSLQARFQRTSNLHQGEFEIALLVAETIDRELDLTRVRQLFDDLLLPLVDAQVREPAEVLELFAHAGFGDNTPVQAGLQHSNLQWVMENRQGIPITLAALLIESARRCGLVSHGVNYPGHFLVSIAGQLFDPLRMQPLDMDQLRGDALDEESLHSLMQAATPKMFGLRMLNNVKAVHMHAHDWASALDVVDYQLAIAGDDPALSASLYYERGEFWEQVGAFAAAAEAFQRCAEISPYRELAGKASERAEELAQRSETLH